LPVPPYNRASHGAATVSTGLIATSIQTML
jgi:hypothetical protein